MKTLILIFVLMKSVAFASDLSVCEVSITGGIIKEKSSDPYFVLSNNGKKVIFSINKIQPLDYCSFWKSLNVKQLFPRQSNVTTAHKLTFKYNRQYTLLGRVSLSDIKENIDISLDSAKDTFSMKAKTKEKSMYTKVKLLINNPMKRDNYIRRYYDHCGDNSYTTKISAYSEYLTNIRAYVGDINVFNVYSSPSIKTKPIFKFKFLNIKDSENIEFILLNNKGLERKRTFKIRKDEKTSAKYTQKILSKKNVLLPNLKAFDAKTVKDAIQILYASNHGYLKGGIQIKMPSLASDPTAIPLSISSKIDFQSIAVFSNRTETPLIAVFVNSLHQNIEYFFKIKLRDNYSNKHTITVIGLGRDGKLYKSVENGMIYLGDACGAA